MGVRHNTNQYILVPDRIWDGDHDVARSGLAVVVNGAEIKNVLPIEKIDVGQQRIDLPGCTLIPGLIDAHTHYMASSGYAYLGAGVTTVRDTGNNLNFILKQRELNRTNAGRGPRIVCCGPALDGPDGIWHHVVKHHANEDELRASIRENIEMGVDAIKLYASIDLPLLRAGVEEAKAAGMFVLAHLNATSSVDAARAGLDEIEHFSRCDVGWKEGTREENDFLTDIFLEHQTVMNPTLGVWDRLGRCMEHLFLYDRRREWVHPELLEIWDSIPYRRSESNPRLKFQAAMPNLKRFLLHCHEKDVTIAAGTDAPFVLIPGFSLHDELAFYVDAGLKPIDALRAATTTNAKVLNLYHEIGRISPNMKADMVAIKGNPVDRIDDLGNVDTVIRNGVCLDPDMLLEKSRDEFQLSLNDPMVRDFRPWVASDLPKYSQKVGDD